MLKGLEYDEVVRADKIGSPSSISYDIVNHIIKSDLVIADVSDLNPNVFYELAIRNAIQKPVIVIKAEDQKMPFDIYDKRAISLEMSDARQWTNAKKELTTQVQNAEKDPQTASKSILSDFSGFQIEPSNNEGTESDLKLEIKDMRSEMRRIYDEVRRPRATASRKSIEEFRERRRNEILEFVIYKKAHGEVFGDRDALSIEISRNIGIPRRTADRYISELFDSEKLIEDNGEIRIGDSP